MHEYEREVLRRRRREHLILRVDRADLSKNVLRGFTAFDLFLEQHPEFREQVTFIAHLIPSRQDVPEYAEYLEKIEALVAVVNHRHGTTDWMPIDLRLRENLEEAIAAYKHYDLLIVNAMFDGMNLVAKEGPLVNERHGVSLLSENTGAHEELGEFALSVNPFDVQEQADAIHRAPDDVRRGALLAGRGPEADHPRARPGRLGRRPAARHRGQARGRAGYGLEEFGRARLRRAEGALARGADRRPVGLAKAGGHGCRALRAGDRAGGGRRQSRWAGRRRFGFGCLGFADRRRPTGGGGSVGLRGWRCRTTGAAGVAPTVSGGSAWPRPEHAFGPRAA